MKTPTLLKLLLPVGIGSLLATGCVTRERVVYRQAPAPVMAQSEIVVTAPPPPPIEETVTISPGPTYIWVGGNWVWRGHWVWEAGHWGHPPRPGAVWVAHRYEYRNGVHIYIRGGWR